MPEFLPHEVLFTARGRNKRLPCALEVELTEALRVRVLAERQRRGLDVIELRAIMHLDPTQIESLMTDPRAWCLSEAIYWAEKLELPIRIKE